MKITLLLQELFWKTQGRNTIGLIGRKADSSFSMQITHHGKMFPLHCLQALGRFMWRTFRKRKSTPMIISRFPMVRFHQLETKAKSSTKWELCF